MIDRPNQLAAKQAKISGPQLIAMVTTLESMVIALAAAEAPTRPDPKGFIRKLREDALGGTRRFGNQEAMTFAEEYVDDVIEEVVRESGVDMGEADGKA